jgi:hypothetical protein
MKNLIFCDSTYYLSQIYDKINSSKKFFFEESLIFVNTREELAYLDKRISEKAIVIIKKKNEYIPEFATFKLNSELLNKYQDIELCFYSMFDFYEFDSHQNGSKDKRISYYYYLNNLINLVEKYNLNSVFFTQPPHSLVEVLIGNFFEKNNFKVLLARSLPIPELYKFEKSMKSLDCIDFNLTNKTDSSDKLIDNFIDKYKKNFDTINDKNNYINYDLIKLYNFFKKIKIFPYFFFIIFFNIKYLFRLTVITLKIFLIFINDKKKNLNKLNDYLNLKTIFSNKETYIHNSGLNKFKLENIFYLGHLSKNKNLLFYKKLSKKINLNEKFFYFPMWFQPSSTTYPFAQRHIDYELSLQILSEIIPSDYKIYVKESPDIFNISNHAWFRGNFVRNKKFYENISKISKVVLVDFDIKDFELFDNCKAVVSLSDKNGLISIIRNKPHISFVKTLSSNLNNSFYDENISKIKFVIDKIVSSVIKINDKEKDNFFIWLKKASFYRPTNKGLNDMSYECNFEKIADCLEKNI